MPVYVIQAGEGGPVKIGFSTNVLRRIENMQVASAAPLRLVVLLDGSQEAEREIHARMSHHRLRGEWFSPAVLSETFGLASLPVPVRESGGWRAEWSADQIARVTEQRRAKWADPEWAAKTRATVRATTLVRRERELAKAEAAVAAARAGGNDRWARFVEKRVRKISSLIAASSPGCVA